MDSIERTDLGNDEYKRMLTEDIRRYIRLRESGTSDKVMQLAFEFQNAPVEAENDPDKEFTQAVNEQSDCDGSFLPYDSEGRYWS
jgi:hypothetical protein